MKALTIWQPYSSLWAKGVKKYETRSWATSYRGPIAIHAAKRPVRKVIDSLGEQGAWDTLKTIESLFQLPGELDQLPTGAIVGTANLVGCNLITEEFVAQLSPQELALGDFTIGRYAWEITDRIVFDNPIQAKGAQGFWNWEATNGKSNT